MTNEIKEILDKLEYVSNEIKAHIQDGNIKAKEIPSSLGKELRLNSYSAKVLLDYITNLQEENEKVHKDFSELSERYFFTKSRNEKAVEYIKWNLDKNQELIEYFNYDANFNELLDILRGDE